MLLFRFVLSTLAVGLCLPTLAQSKIPTMPPDADKELALDIFKEFIEIPSGFTTGATTPVAQAAAARLRAAGFPDTDIFLGGASDKKLNLVVRYHGSGAKKPLLLLAHTDVVEAKREDWSLDPFKLVEKDGYFYGRGTSDDKAQAAIWLATLIRFKREGFKPDRDLILAMTADEEGGGPFNGVDWLIKNHRDLIDAELCLNEGGWGEMLVSGKRIANDVQVSEKYVMSFRLEVKNKGGHSSLPVADNAIYQLANGLVRLSKFQFPVKTNEVTVAYFAQMAKIEAGSMKTELGKAASGSQDSMAKVAAASTVWNATLRTTCVATMLEGGHALNALPQLAAATVNCRVMPEDSPEYVESTLKKVLADDGIGLTELPSMGRAPASPMRQDLLGAVQSITEEMWPGVATLPMMVPGATDGRYLRAVGIPTYGVQGLFLDTDDMRMHGRDERLRVTSFYEGQTFMYELVKRMSK